MRKSTAALLGLVGCLTSALPAVGFGASGNVTITPDTAGAGPEISRDYAGVSFEIKMLLPTADGKYYFNPENKALIKTFELLGIHNLRVGGNTTDTPGTPIPMGADIDNLYGFAREVNVPVIYTLRLRKESDPTDAMRIAKYVMDHYASQTECFEAGNEPDLYGKFPVYLDMLKKYMAAICAPGVAPDAKFCGPCATNPDKWGAELAAAMDGDPHFALICEHWYPGRNARAVTDPAEARIKILSPQMHDAYEKMYEALGPACKEHHFPYRLEETNSFYNGGAKDVSDTHASALWALDYLYWWAAHGCQGINFHTGDIVAAGDTQTVSRYTLFVSSDQGYNIHPNGYAVKAFNLGASGHAAEAKIDSPDGLNVSAYSTRNDQDQLTVTVINKEHDANGKDAAATIQAGSHYTHGKYMLLESPGHDLAAKSGITLGGSSIGDDASWDGKWTDISAPQNGQFSLTVPEASAAIVQLTP